VIQKFNLNIVINQAELLSKYDDKSSKYFLVDVRSAYEFQDHHIPGSHNIPIDDLPDRLAELPADQHIITVCERGKVRSPYAEQLLRNNKFTCDHLEGGLTHWTGQLESN